MIKIALKENEADNSQLQVSCINELDGIFFHDKIQSFNEKNYFFNGVRGKYDGIKNYSICFEFDYCDFFFEFYLSYDQLEFYISKDGKIIRECNLEDFWEDRIMIEKFITYLKKDLKRLEIPFNE